MSVIGGDITTGDAIADDRLHVVEVTRHCAFVEQLKLRGRDLVGSQFMARWHIAWAKEIEHRWAAPGALAQAAGRVAGVTNGPATCGAGDAEAAPPLHKTVHRLTQAARCIA